MTSLTWDRHRGHCGSYDVLEAGWNYRLDEMRAALLRVQLGRLDELNRARGERVEWYREQLGDDPRFRIPFRAAAGVSAFHLFPIVLAEGVAREPVMARLQAHGVQTSVHYPPIHQFTFYRRLGLPTSDLRVTEALGRRLLTLPLFPAMTAEQVEYVCDSLRAALAPEQVGKEACS
jgi:dTDP-4-amino-4,6-dideoxygalactose transaminase